MEQEASYRLSELWIYPVKSLPGIKLESCYAGERGLEGDRRFMLADNDGRFISIRENRELLRFRLEMDATHINFGFEGEPGSCRIERFPAGGRNLSVKIWEDETEAIEPDAAVSEWFSGILGRPCRLVYMSDDAHRTISNQWQTGHDLVSFADGYAYLAVSRASLDEISRLTNQYMDVRRFRPNLVIDGPASRDELHWRRLRVGNVTLEGLKPCARCVVTTIDPDTIEAGREPLRTLSLNRIGGNAVFGQHCSISLPGQIAVGDAVTILGRKDSPYDPLYLGSGS